MLTYNARARPSPSKPGGSSLGLGLALGVIPLLPFAHATVCLHQLTCPTRHTPYIVGTSEFHYVWRLVHSSLSGKMSRHLSTQEEEELVKKHLYILLLAAPATYKIRATSWSLALLHFQCCHCREYKLLETWNWANKNELLSNFFWKVAHLNEIFSNASLRLLIFTTQYLRHKLSWGVFKKVCVFGLC